jgi:tetratricopeptide (TPR) repeat protein
VDAATAGSILETVEDARAAMRREEPGAAAPIENRYDQVLEALDWYLAEGPADEAFRLATALVLFWTSTGRIDDGDAWFRRALDGADGSEARRARATYDHGYLVFWAGRYADADRAFTDARARAATLGEANLAALALAGSARVALARDPAESVRLLREALDLTEATPDAEGRSSALHVLGVALQMAGDLNGARDVMTERLEAARRTGNEFAVWVESANLSMVERQLGHLDRAERLSREALSIVAGRGDALAVPWVINGLAAATAAKGGLERAAILNGLAEALLRHAGGEWPPDEQEQFDGTLAAIAAGLAPDVAERFRAEGAAMSTEDGVAYALGPGT